MTGDTAGGVGFEAVVPVARTDVDRLRLVLIPSLQRFCRPLSRLYVVVPDIDEQHVRRVLGDDSFFDVVAESDVAPELRLFDRPLTRAGLRALRPTLAGREPDRIRQGWFRQQVIKLAFARWCSSDFYLYLDADVICTREPVGDDLIRNGRARYQIDEQHALAEWFEWSAEVLGVERASVAYGVTPTILHRSSVLDLGLALERLPSTRVHRLRPALRAVGPPGSAVSTWVAELILRLPWTEHSLYFTHLEQTGRRDQYHFCEPDRSVYGNSLWSGGTFDSWRPELSFDPDAPFVFSVVQSNRRVPAESVRRRVRPWLG